MSGDAWRLLGLQSGAPEWNMAVDRAIQEARAAGQCAPTLRLYQFDPPSVTIGRFQDVSDLDTDVLEREGLGVARRPTGGRGVLHSDEVTYSVVAGTEDGLPRGVAASYAHLSRFLIETYRLLGIEARLTGEERPSNQGGACYMQRTRADLMIDDKKLSGSAQVWTDDVCLQHGSIVMTRDPVLEADLFRLGETDRKILESCTVSLADATGRVPSSEEVSEAAIEGSRRAFGVDLLPSTLSGEEMDRAEELLEQYSVHLS